MATTGRSNALRSSLPRLNRRRRPTDTTQGRQFMERTGGSGLTSKAPFDLHKDRRLRQVSCPQYVIESLLATGGFSQVFVGRYEDEGMDANHDSYKVAIKVCQVEEGEPEVEGEVEREKEGATLETSEENDEDAELNFEAEEELLFGPPNRASRLEAIAREIAVLDRLSPNPHVCRYIESFMYKTDHVAEVWIVMELLCVDLQTAQGLCWEEDRFSSGQIRTIAKQTLEALKFMHKQRVVHKDLKLSNILLSSTGVIKLCDFGIAQILPHAGAPPLKVEKRIGTLGYMAPELLHPGQPYSELVDVWSFGVVLYLLTEGADIREMGSQRDLFEPFSDDTWAAFAESNCGYFKALLGKQGYAEVEDSAIDHADDEEAFVGADVRQRYWAVIKNCLSPLPVNGLDGEITRSNLLRRATVGQLLNSPYFADMDHSELAKRNHITSAVKNYQKALRNRSSRLARDTSSISSF